MSKSHPAATHRVLLRRFRQPIAIFGIALFATTLVAPSCRAQLATAGTITGTIADQSGAVIPGAKVTITDTDTKVKTLVMSNSVGVYTQVGLTSGHYAVTIVSAGFSTFEKTGIYLEPAGTSTVNATLKPGQTSETVTVAASAATVETATPEISNTVSGEEAAELPLNGRNYEGLVQLMPGVINTSPDNAMGPGGFATTNYVNLNGSGASGTFYTIDGIWNENTGNMTQTTITPVPEEIEEIKVLQNNYDVKYTLMGAGVMMVQTKSGGSHFHGGAWEFLRNKAFDTRNFFAPTANGIPGEHWNIFGWHLGGPVFIPGHYNTDRQRTFFYWNQQWIREKNGSTVTGQTALASMRGQGTSGADSGYAIFPGTAASPIPYTVMPDPYGTAYLKDPSTSGSCNASSQTACFGQDANGNWLIPMTRVNTSQLAMLNAMAPLPNYSSGATNYLNTNPNVTNQLDEEAKVDHYITRKFRLTGELLWESQNAYNANAARMGSPFSTNWDTFISDNKLAQVSLTQIYTASMTNTTSIAMNNYNITHGFGGITHYSQIKDYSQQFPYNGGYLENYVPHITFGSGGWSQFGSSANNIIPAATDLEDTVSDSWSWQRGKHLIEAGGEMVFGTKRQWSTVQNTTGDAGFNGYATGNAIADFLLGMPNNFDQGDGAIRKYIHYTIFSPYVSDQYRALRRLKITIGLRMFRMPFPNSQPGYSANFNPALFNSANVPTVSIGGVLSGPHATNYTNGIELNGQNGVPLNITNQNNFYVAPMGGFALDVFGNGKTALRGGFGIAHNRAMGAACAQGCVSYPVLTQTVLTNPTFPNVPGGTNPPPTAGTIAGMPKDYQVATIKTWSLSLEQQLPGDWLVGIAGAGDIANHLNTNNYNLNQPPPTNVNGVAYDFNPNLNTSGYSSAYYAPYQGWGTINWNNPINNDNWDALEVSVKHPMGHNFSFTLAYTWSHNLDNTGGFQNPYNLHSAYGNSNLNTPQVFTFSGIFTEPWFKTGVKRFILGGWKYSDMTTIQSGSSSTFGISGSNLGPIIRPNIVGPISYPKQWNPHKYGSSAAWFATGTGAGTAAGSIFKRPANGYYGNGRNGNEVGPGVVVSNMALYKLFPLHEALNLEFRAEYFNVFNHTNPNGPNLTAGNAAFGQISSAKDPRLGQMSLKLSF